MKSKTKGFAVKLFAAAIIFAGASTITSFAETSDVTSNTPRPEGKITIEGTATIYGNWKCEGSASVNATPGIALEPVPGFPGGVKTTKVTVTVHDIECGDGTMNKHLRKALKEKDFPKIHFETDKYTLRNNGGAVKAFGELTIAGVTKPVELDAELSALSQGGVRVVGKTDIKMKEYAVKPPSLLFGTLKVANDITVKFDTEIEPPDDVEQVSASMNVGQAQGQK